MKVIDKVALQAWIESNQFDSDAVVPPLTCPPEQHLENGVCVPDAVVPPPTDYIYNLNKTTHVGSGFYGYNASAGPGAVDFSAKGGVLYKFLIDPKSISVNGKPQLKVGDRLQASPCNSITLSILNAAEAKTGLTVPIVPLGNASYGTQWPKATIYMGQKLLLELVPSTDMWMMVYWNV